VTTDGCPLSGSTRRRPSKPDWFPADAHYDVVVVGAGLTGLSTALLLAQAGRQVAVLEARSVGAVTTGHSTAKATLLQATQLSKITSSHSQHVAGAYVDGNREGQQWLQAYCQDHGITLSSATPTPTRYSRWRSLRYAVNSTLPADSVLLSS
jgi:glycine/D-amino acid oxidase-like deaminating enzyme